jgi:hypothetical protein
MQKCLQFLIQGGKCLPTNYRPISVLPVISKLIENHISRHMYQYLAKYNLLHDAQSGIRSNHSCQSALINIIDKWIEEMNNGNVNVVILLDLTKRPLMLLTMISWLKSLKYMDSIKKL